MTWKWIREEIVNSYWICDKDSEFKLIHYVIRESTLSSLSISRIQFEFTIILAILLWIYYLNREFTANSLWLHEFTFNSPFITRIHFEFPIFSRINFELTIFFSNSLSIHYCFLEFTFNSLSFLRINFEFTICFANALQIHYLFWELTLNSQFFSNSRIHFHCTIFIANSFWIPYLLRE